MKTNATAMKLSLLAPVSGPMMPIEQVPDPVFAQKMVGDGISIDPLTNELLAPCAGKILHLHPALHAITLGLDSGVELLLHVGVDTVGQKGKGFEALVKEGDQVKTGQSMIRFDLDGLACNAKSLLTQLVVSTPELVTGFAPREGNVTAGKDVVLELELAPPSTRTQAADTSKVSARNGQHSKPIPIPNATGIHARPAAVLANMAKRYDSAIQLECAGRLANAKSLTALMKLNVSHNDKVVLMANGTDAKEALKALEEAIRSGLGDMDGAPVSTPASTVISPKAAVPQKAVPQKAVPRPVSDNPDLVLGVAASPGLAVGFVQQLERREIHIQDKGGNPAEEKAALDDAFKKAKRDLEALQMKLHSENNSPQAAIFAAHAELLGDPDLVSVADSAIANGRAAGIAWRTAFEQQAEELAQMDNELLAERAHDLRDVGRRVLTILAGEDAPQVTFKEQTILIAEDLSPSDTAQLDRNKILGFCTVHGGGTSHAAILARSMGIPAVVGAEARILQVDNGAPLILNGSSGEVRLHPPKELIKEVAELGKKIETKRKRDMATAKDPAKTKDGHPIEVVANIGAAKEAGQIAEMGGEGVGLLRSEFLFMDRATAPTEDEQVAAYTDILKAMPPGAPLIIRTLDVGGDKPLRYLPLPAEENPFLGIRGVRVGLQYPDLLRTQMRAILRAASKGNVRIMFPMIASIGEWREVKGMLDQEVKGLGCKTIPAGIMVEVPATAVLAEQFAKEVDFFSVGTNDLSQYTLAMDRGHPQLAARIDGLDPAVLHLIALAAKAGKKENKMVGVCGGTAGELQAVPILIGLGVTELSVSIPVIPAVKALIRSVSMEECKKLGTQALTKSTASEVRKLTPPSMELKVDLGKVEKGGNQ